MNIIYPIFTRQNWKKTIIEIIPLVIFSMFFGVWIRTGGGFLLWFLAVGFFCIHIDLFFNFRKKTASEGGKKNEK
jgi:thiamine transporter ThiT